MITGEYILRLAMAYTIHAYKEKDTEESKLYWIGVYRQLRDIEILDIKVKEKN